MLNLDRKGQNLKPFHCLNGLLQTYPFFRLTNEGKLVGPALMDHLSYTKKSINYLKTCSLASVLLYDREYCQLQSNMGFRWGTDVQHLHMLHLQRSDRQVKTGTQTHTGRKSTNNTQPHYSNLRGKVVSVRTIIVRKVVSSRSAISAPVYITRV